jgi:hypothetical protein
MSREELKVDGCFPKNADPALGHADNDVYRTLLKSVESGNFLTVAGVSHPGIVCPLSGLQGVSNKGKPLGMEIACAEAAILDEDGSLNALEFSYLQDGFSDALGVTYLLDTSICCVRSFLEDTALYTRSPYLLKAMAQQRGFPFPEGYLRDEVGSQIKSRTIRAVRIDLSTGELTLGTVSSDADTVVPHFLLQRFAKRFIEDLYEQPARIYYPDAEGKVRSYAVALQEKFLRSRFHAGAATYRRIAWDGQSPDVVLPVYSVNEPTRREIKLFSLFEIRDIERFTF